MAALYDVSDDWIPIYDRSSLPGFYMAVGTSGNQFKNAPLAGVLMAELIGACEAGRDHDRDPVTVTGHYTGCAIDLGFFSRLRQVNATAASPCSAERFSRASSANRFYPTLNRYSSRSRMATGADWG